MLFLIKQQDFLIYSYIILLFLFGPLVVQNQHCWTRKSVPATRAPSPRTILPLTNWFHLTANFSLQKYRPSQQISSSDHQTTCGCITKDDRILDLSLLAPHSAESRESAATTKAQKLRGKTLTAGNRRVNPHHDDRSNREGVLNATFLVDGRIIMFLFNPCEPIQCEVRESAR